ncbi:hypothetical protein FSP39_018876 [Pinctada imbricata]|uniref:Vesicle transport v-SNARE N-terminal domain-containing protein n=1 Tax=Pinctada imbricata TaxID=66713 RepID=A0AA89BRF0_PINIB|nr:hypothetical protein FSP39_018876 [Pinctada imbricata]
MTTLIESYEQQYSNLTADITYNVGRISNTSGAEKQKHVRQVDKMFDEVTELLEQMDLEVKDLAPSNKQKYQTRVKSYKAELKKLQTDYKRAKLGINSSRDELLGDDTHDSEDQRQRLLDNTENLDRSTRRLDHGYRVALETEQIGAQLMEDLHHQRQTINRSRGRDCTEQTVISVCWCNIDNCGQLSYILYGEEEILISTVLEDHDLSSYM